MSNNIGESVFDNNAVTETTKSQKRRPEPLILKLFQLGFKIGGRLSPAIAGRIAYNLWFTPTRFKTPASERNALESAAVEFHRVKNHNIATFSWGQSGPVILLVHGWSGRGTQLGSFVEPLINAGYRVLSFDAPAHGLSSGKQTNLYEVADTMLALQDHYGDFASVITHSFGGPSTAVAMQRGLRAKSMVSISPPATTIGLVEKFSRVLQLPEKAGARLIELIETSFGKNIWEDISMGNTIKEIDMPGMVIHDAQDIDIPWEEGQAVACAWNNAPFKITSGLGHRRILRDADVIESAIDFIKKQEVNR